MALFKWLFGADNSHQQQPSIRFGRYTDAYKAPACYAAWDEAQALFENDDFLQAYEQFLIYLRDEDEDNVKWERAKGGLKFEIYQGSKKLSGFATPQKVRVEAPVVQAESFNIGLLRQLLEHNFHLKYGRFTLDTSGNIVLVFDTYTLDGSPYKLYYALREVALKADKQDDLLLEEFQSLQPVETTHLEALPEAEKLAKYEFIKQKLQATLNEAENGSLDRNRYASSYGYLLLDLIFRLDYLIKPEGFMMETLEKLQRKYYANNGKTTAAKNEALCKGLHGLLERPPSDYFREMYRGKSTFGITHTVNHDRVAAIIEGELYHMDWYLEHGHQQMALAIPGYIVGFCLFNYAVPKPDRDLFHLYYQIAEEPYFQSLGFQNEFTGHNGQLQKRNIRRAILRIVEGNKPFFPQLSFPTQTLDYTNMPAFARSFLNAIKTLNLTKTL
ncbi:YbjN domain-containing protein [Phaeodactylibacter luteus]|uniref:YbjN domain-containing protein n=1 Tax=Phaeodactylibacter luteus TaxID=1564516 RepID=A0A5C6RJ75_9BACT|nr:YbjN domain-containing protein [Phaeodactylibacter luteus]TXB62247.1 YbjN domain-containing protein [Phaeodactylibacter luteus]